MSATQKLLRFGVFELNLDTEELSKSGIGVKLPPQPLKLLVLLASHAGQVVARDEIQQQLWAGETFVDFEHGVNKCINQIRTALGDDADRPLYIETLPRRGYRFVAPVLSKTIPAPQPKMIESDSGERSRLPVLIGGRTRAATAAGGSGGGQPSGRCAGCETRQPSQRQSAAYTHESRSRVWRARLVWIGMAVLAGCGRRRRTVLALAHVQATCAHRQRHDRAGRLRQQNRRPGIRRHLEAGTRHSVGAIAISRSDFARQSESDLEADGPFRRRPLTPEVAREVCQRTGSKAMLTGSIASLGSQYVIGLKAVNCNTGDMLAEAQEQAAGKEAVLKALDAAAISLRSKLGESLSVGAEIRDAIGGSYDAIAGGAASLQPGEKDDYHERVTSAALPLLKRAVELDPNFAVAYAAMAVSYNNLDEIGLAAEYARKAYALRMKVSERERLVIEIVLLHVRHRRIGEGRAGI